MQTEAWSVLWAVGGQLLAVAAFALANLFQSLQTGQLTIGEGIVDWSVEGFLFLSVLWIYAGTMLWEQLRATLPFAFAYVRALVLWL